MSRITDYILEPKVVYTEGGFLVRVKVIDDYKYKKYIVSENLHYKTVQGTTFTLTDAEENKQASITELKGNTTQEGTPTPSSPVEVKTVSGDNNIVVSNKNLFDKEDTSIRLNAYTSGGKIVSGSNNRSIFVACQPNTTYTISKKIGTQFTVVATTDRPAIRSKLYQFVIQKNYNRRKRICNSNNSK